MNKTLFSIILLTGLLIIPFNVMVFAEEGDLLLTINNPTPEKNEYFGASVAVTPDGNFLVGSSLDNTGSTNAGSAYLFDGTDGSLLLSINNPTPEENDRFGHSVAVTPNGNFLIGALNDSTGAFRSGSIYLFDGTNGSLLLTINNPTPEQYGEFGFSVAVTPDGNFLVGVRNENTGAFRAGSAYLFDGTNGSLLLTINNPTPEENEYFGASVAVTPDGNLLIGANNENTGADRTGSAYLFDGTNGSLLLTINNPTPEKYDKFGHSVAVTPNGNFLIGAFYDNTGASRTGSAYLFDGTNGSLLLTINNPTPDQGDVFGYSVAATPDGSLLISILFDNTGADSAGSVYLFEGPPLPIEEIFCGKPESSYNRIEGTEKRDLLIGTDANDLIFGYGGDDFISGGLGDDCIFGGNGKDVIHGNYRGDDVYDGADIINGGHGLNIIFGMDRKDIVVAINSDATHQLGDKPGEYDIFRDGRDMNILLSMSGDELEFKNPRDTDGPVPDDPPDAPPGFP